MTHHTDAELMPCPFCGGKDILVKARKTTMVECKDCGAVMFDYQDGVQRNAIDAWNRRAPAAPVPQSEPVAYLWQHCETGRTRVVMPDMVITADANWIVVGPLYLAAAPQPPEAAPVELPEPDAWMATPVMQSGRGATTVFCSDKRMADQWDYGGHPEYGRMLVTGLFTEQKVRALLAGVSAPAAPPASQRDELLQVAIDFIGTLTGMAPPPIEVAPPEVFAPFYAFVERVQAITAPQAPAADATQLATQADALQ